ncbi:heme ABC transporter substrate-binding protein IsdE [Bacillus sp. J14TS2]|uniref:ABC transporter substrate-binding protein n=1 Tax=Bacillus sp. J14TS2 TaxID=2807188 RepID=UPI001B123B37|nr:ABC transporter substrate-binding protein [Bacillus sp. J14TS2]GIN71830.1 heme ABC transporter substrate-binding protein IsdE [Bacillus sp. J14TS2]
MKKYTIILFIFFITLLAACSAETNTNKEADDHQEESKVQVNETDNKAALEEDGVDETALDEALEQFPKEIPERIITTSVPITEMLHLLEITPIGVPTSTNPIPKEFEEIDQIGSPMQPDLEVVTSLNPDLIIGAKSLESSLEKNLEGIEMDRAYLNTDSFHDLKLSFKVLGTYFDKTDKMNEAMSQIVEKENELAERAEGKELPRVLLIIGTSDSFMVMNEKSYLGSIIETLGAENIATTVLNATETYSPINMEAVVEADPDIIFVLASGDHGASEDMFQKEINDNDVWTKLAAYKNDRIHILDYDVFGVTSILNVEKALTEIADYVYQ